MITNMAELLAAHERGERFEYIFFWGHQPRPDGEIGKSCLSQWWPAEFEMDGVRYGTAEHYMMAAKARLFNDPVRLEQILAAEHPEQVKKLGRQVEGFDREVWERHRVEIVATANYAKFGQNEALRAYLLGSGERILVEASPYDKIWGIGLGEGAEGIEDPTRWGGLNLLGFVLMGVRGRLAEGRGETGSD
ncbi:MAG TPA: NADAR family protein [Anaerolineae bacterium]|nr:NADAR family protein [Anaerolineae bacterium]